jgi:competence protein ComEA
MDEDTRRAALVRAAAHAYEAAHGNPLPEPVSGLRWSIRPRVAVTVLALLALVVAAAVFAAQAPSGAVEVASSSDAAASDEPLGGAVVTVHVVGAVAVPGLYELPLGSRVGDAIDAAGGAAEQADLAATNLARQLIDGEQVVVSVAGETESAGTPGSGLLNLNRADSAALEALPGIGPVLAERIVKDRDSKGPFRSVDELDRVIGVGPAVLDQVRPLLTV